MDNTLFNADAVKEKISELEEAIPNALQQVFVMETELKAYKNMLSPILKLPTDVLSLIFGLCTDSWHIYEYVPWVSSYTCRRWRDVALSYPFLWNVVRIDANLQTYSLLNSDMLKTWFARSQSLPLSCDVRFRPYPEDLDSDDSGLDEGVDDSMIHDKILDLLLSESQRWLDMSFKMDLYHCLATTTRPFTLLRYLHINVQFSSSHRSLIPRTFNASAFASAPNLVEVSVDVPKPLPVVSLPWHQLKRYYCGSTPEESNFLDLAKLVKIEHLIFTLCKPLVVSPQRQPLHLINLRRLDIFGWGQPIMKTLPFLHLPSLEDLFLHSSDPKISPDIIRLIFDVQEGSS
ncbi:hypothetical protein E1B28_003511 [Marasmius oreades]|uniref:F-box domain-containing protein n=1 Tax=Marasmius oreades TaxID=181124 RepID=A0A9P7RMP5_9AGAR|nr:uncharacterized protein E1B28_003511 [Marasmius oreades]KAG7085988.1 hypothetical protein E1B28_003511 [Marasmius oreades]